VELKAQTLADPDSDAVYYRFVVRERGAVGVATRSSWMWATGSEMAVADTCHRPSGARARLRVDRRMARRMDPLLVRVLPRRAPRSAAERPGGDLRRTARLVRAVPVPIDRTIHRKPGE